MSVKIGFHKAQQKKADTAVACVYAGNHLGAGALALDREQGGFIQNHLKMQKKFTGKKGQILTLAVPGKASCIRIILAGMGEPGKLDAIAAESAGGGVYAALAAAGSGHVSLLVADEKPKGGHLPSADLAAHMALGLKLRSYSFNKYKMVRKDKGGEMKLAVADIVGDHAPAAEKIFAPMAHAGQGVFFARDMINEPPNVLYPDSFAKRIKAELAPLGVEVEIFDEKKMKALGFGAHLAVGMGSAFKPRVVVMRWHGGRKKKGREMDEPLAFVGKGLTFDTGGVNLKPTGGVEDMKYDMGGAATVAGLMKTLALRKSKASVVGIVGLAENALDGSSYRPSDVLKSLSGKTIEVMNTDAEGRLVLADALTYVQRTYKPRMMIDLATLTGAIVIALGAEYCGTFSNNDKLWEQMDKAGKSCGEKLWRMPLDESFSKELDSHIADVKSLGNLARNAGSSIAACFLERFVEGNIPWAHMDIAGVAYTKSDRPTCPKSSGVGFGIRLLDRLVADHYEP